MNVLHLGSTLGFPEGWIEHLATAIWLAPENDDLWLDDSTRRKEARNQLKDRLHDAPFCRRPLQQSNSMKKQNDRISWTFAGYSFTLSMPPRIPKHQLAEALREKATDLQESGDTTS